MSAPLRLTAEQLGRLAGFLSDLTETRQRTGVMADAYGPVDIAIDGNTLRISWDADLSQYVIDDQNGA